MSEEHHEEILHEPPSPSTAHPTKPALTRKKKPSSSKKNKTKILTWDEHAIEEHDQLRGSRMKIDEPNTPYAATYYSDDDSKASGGGASIDGVSRNMSMSSADNNHGHLNWDHLENKLGAVAAVRDTLPSSPSCSSYDGIHTSDSEGELAAKERMRRRLKGKEFKMMRKAHYNEMEAVKKWRAEHDDEDEEGENDDAGGNRNDTDVEMSS